MATATYAVTQFTPAASCGIGASLWAVTKTCFMTVSMASLAIDPPWMTCTAVQAGEPPDRSNTACYNNRVAGQASACPVGYSAASSLTWAPFSRGGATTTTAAADVVAAVVYCCPSAGVEQDGMGIDFWYSGDGASPDITTEHDGVTYTGNMYLMPLCRATRVSALSGSTVTLTPYSDTQGWERRRRQEATLVTEMWDYTANVIYAEAESFTRTVFADGHTCYGNCTDYWLRWYTSPERLANAATATATVTTSTSIAGASSPQGGGAATPTRTTESASGSGAMATGISTAGESRQGPAPASGAHRPILGGAGTLLTVAAVAACLAV